MRKNYKKKFNGGFNFGEKKYFKNIPHEAKFNPVKEWRGTVTCGDKSYLFLYETDIRSEAVRYFERKAKEINGTLDKFISAKKVNR